MALNGAFGALVACSANQLHQDAYSKCSLALGALVQGRFYVFGRLLLLSFMGWLELPKIMTLF
jgi:hypothetical protein